MHPSERHKGIVQLVRDKGFITIEELARQFAVTPQTIRRDINQLDEQNLLRRFHGGAGLPDSSTANLAYDDRKIRMLEEKTRIAEAIARRVPNHASLFINIGTTTETIARALLHHDGLTVITNNLHVASILSTRDDFRIIMAGGVVRNRDGGIMGEATIDFMRQFKVDIGIIGISGIDDDGELLDFDYQEIRVSQAIVENSRALYLAADHSKFGRNAMVRMGNLREATHLFTDQAPPASIQRIIDESDLQLVIA